MLVFIRSGREFDSLRLHYKKRLIEKISLFLLERFDSNVNNFRKKLFTASALRTYFHSNIRRPPPHIEFNASPSPPFNFINNNFERGELCKTKFCC